MSQDLYMSLSQELGELFDIKKAQIRNEKKLTQEAMEAQKDIRLLTLMFREGIPDVTVEISNFESISWSSQAKQLLYQNNAGTQILEGTSRETRIRVRPFLTEMVKKAKEMVNKS